MLLQPSARTSFGFKCFAFGIRHGSERSILVGEHAAHQGFVVAEVDFLHFANLTSCCYV
ncbi:unknown protein encoded within prophage CP-933R [Escherichia coli O157:H7 str. EDL933]|uniref:Uncharacterized protein n=1 Tax=Escherichia coli O157:H7 TaxID=83334 RepID=A0A0H3JDQ0_ECO57|nr:hypothetical protein ECs1938 [imported] - Escherichia coli (strain O157:H7, substrain RIMD 0509952) [Escherichia coli]pir/E64885/ hypothetical protein b1354 - Escherichia coli (strain K-12) [Escherichia coli]pir/G85747/ unknown protein encoded within prophage CP-933R [imported] - Escherichia coli (strain O157:H7, substrain EDL933) [Escherichia coli]AAG56443.1 unknown protein encoded within prophage CP-933R [Escherichia coli O157:H7 str. EDL933]